MPQVAELVRELLAAYADGTPPPDAWLQERLTAEAFRRVPPERLNPFMLELVPSRWNGGEGFVVQSESDRMLVGFLGDDRVVTVAVRASGLLRGRKGTRIELPLFTPRPGDPEGPVEASVRELFAAYAVGGAPSDDWIAGRFNASFLASVPLEKLHALMCSAIPPRWRGGSGLAVLDENDGRLTATLGADTKVTATLAPGEKVKLSGLRFEPYSRTVDDPRLRDLPVTAPAEDEVRQVCEDHGLVGVSAAGEGWTAVAGWLDVDARTPVREDSVLCAYSITKLITTSVVLDLVAKGTVELDRPANDYLTGRLKIGDDRVTVRHLLGHTGGVITDFPHFAPEVPDQVALLGSVLEVDFEPGTAYRYSNAGFAALGLLVEDVTGRPYADVAQEVVFGPLAMASAHFPTVAPVHGYGEEGGRLVQRERLICTVPSAGGLWCTASDLVRFAQGWKGLLPQELVDEALTPPSGIETLKGLGWACGTEYVGHAGGGTGFRASLLVRRAEGDNPEIVMVALANRDEVAIEQVNALICSAVRGSSG